MDLSKDIFWDLENNVDPDQKPLNEASLFIYSAGFCFANLQTKLTLPKFKIVLSKGILRTFANGADSDQNAESDLGHHCLCLFKRYRTETIFQLLFNNDKGR